MALSENKSLLKSNHTYNKTLDIPSSSSDDWSSTYSSDSSNSKTCSENSYNPDWESYINKNGNVFYIEYNLDTIPSTNPPNQSHQNFDKTSSSSIKHNFNVQTDRRTKKSTIDNQKTLNTNRHERKQSKNVRTKLSNSFNEFANGEMKEVTVFIDPSNRIKFDRRTTLSESILGFTTSQFPNSQRIMISSMSDAFEAQHDKYIKIGDCLKAINNHEINSDNFEHILLSFTQPTTIRLQLKRFYGYDSQPNSMNILKITTTGDFVAALRDLVPVIVEDKLMSGHSTAFTVIYLRDTTDTTYDGTEVIFCYPPKEVNCLYGMRGMFLTLNSIFCERAFDSKPVTTTITIKDTEYYVSYCSINNELLLIALSAKYATYHDMKQKSIEIIRYLQFINKTINHSFQLDQRQYHHNSTIDTNFNIVDLFLIQTHRFLATTSHIKFEETLNECHFIPLPRDVQSRIDDTLGEMEAMNYRHWNNEPLKSRREFYIVGTALYYRRYLLASHLPSFDLLDIETFLRMNGIYLLMDNKSVRDMVIWREIFPMSIERGLSNDNNIYGIPNGRWFLSVVGRNQIFMAVILEARHFHDDTNSSSRDNEIIGPSLFYIEEISDTLDHLRCTGIENLASVWLHSNKRPEVLKEISRENYRFSHSHFATPTSHHLSIRKSEIISILKRRNNSSENVEGNNNNFGFDSKIRNINVNNGGTASINSATLSDGSTQRYDDDGDESDSDWDGFPDSHRSGSGFDLSDVNGLILKEAGDVIPSKITSGQQNVLFHFVHVECDEGIFMAPTTIQSTGQIVSAFRKASLLIHNVLQNTIRFRYLLSQENSKLNAHRSLVAIKEHGVLVSTVNDYDEQIEFWIVGRLYSSPQKELYICHHADIPQNLIEMAFRLSLNSSG